ncbi:hypothetical protein U14_01731 [Candidatus Moduliflexus flocculans]|uniref:Uncharacterized protein n=1 Tax=Candidatus Moduliflexus flocculans TaxID=1499966 RepID=A0A0S6VWB7_9BACT|nr:hypothetical protein U14_01731 [Candidatus Moduliflexus flocculans]
MYKGEMLSNWLEYVIRQRFSELSEQEVRMMLHLTPQELIQIALKERVQQGMQKGKQIGLLAGEIRLAQRILKRQVTEFNELGRKTKKELQAIWRELAALN